MTNGTKIDFSDFDDFTTRYWTDEWFKFKRIDKALESFFKKNGIKRRHPFEIIGIYKRLLNYLKNQNEERYKQLHKGTPFYWIGWFSFLLKNYDQGIFYIDAALAEDKKNHPSNIWPDSGAAMFFDLRLDDYRVFLDRGYSIAPRMKDLLKKELNRFNSKQNNNLILDGFIDSFVKKIIHEDHTEIITTLYSFILEKEDIIEMIKLRGEHGGSIEPMITHLFKGALIFESLMKKHYASNNRNNLGDILKFNNVENIYRYTFKNHKSSADSLEEILKFIGKYINSPETAFYVTCKIRNTTAHNLIWNDLFTVENYEKLYHKIVDAIFYIILYEYNQTRPFRRLYNGIGGRRI